MGQSTPAQRAYPDDEVVLNSDPEVKRAGSVQWVGAVQDITTGIETVLGYLWNAPGQGMIGSSVSWIEDYAMNGPSGNCSTKEPAKAVFSLPILNAGDVTAALGTSLTSNCSGHSSTIQRSGAMLGE